MSANWIPLIGEFQERDSALLFMGKEVEYTAQEGTKLVPALGNAVYGQRFAGGRIAAVVEFETVDEQTGCEIIFFYDPDSGFFATAGLGGGFHLFNIRHYDGKQWTYHRQLGDRVNLRAQKKYALEVVVRGSSISLRVDGVSVTATDLPFNLPESQVGVWCVSRSQISITDYDVQSSPPSAFVVMQFSSPYNEIYSEVIKDICREIGLEVIRADEEVGPGIIIADVSKMIVHSKVVIAEISPANPNVYYEVGYAHALNKPTILIAERGIKLPFDVSPFRTLFYENTIHGKTRLQEGLRKHLQAVMSIQ